MENPFVREVSLILNSTEILSLCSLISLKTTEVDLGWAERERKSRIGKVGPTDGLLFPF